MNAPLPEDPIAEAAEAGAAPRLRESMSRAAVAQATGFAWERTADRTLEVYRMAARAMRDDLEQVGA